MGSFAERKGDGEESDSPKTPFINFVKALISLLDREALPEETGISFFGFALVEKKVMIVN